MILFEGVRQILLLLLPAPDSLDLVLNFFDTTITYSSLFEWVSIWLTLFIGYIVFIRPIEWFLRKVIPGKIIDKSAE